MVEQLKTISIKSEIRGKGLFRALDVLWESWKLLDKGSFSESKENFTLTNQKGDTFIASKTKELFVAKIYNRFISADVKLFEVYEGSNPTGGFFILYRFKDVNRRNEFAISSLGGFGDGSVIIFEIN